MGMSEQELEQILKQNPAVKVHNPHFLAIRRADGNEQLAEQERKITTSKYKNRRTKVDGMLFDSQKEADYYKDLCRMLQGGVILGFCVQPEFILQEGTEEIKPIKYRADFIVWYKDAVEVVDIKASKNFQTEIYKLKKKMFKKKFPKLELIEEF